MNQALGIFFESLCMMYKLRTIPPRCVTVFGSAVDDCAPETLKLGYDTGAYLASKGWAVMTGGGPGVMAMVNKGCLENNGVSIGCNIKLPNEQALNEHTSHSVTCSYFVNRKKALIESAQCFIALPGGFGTLDELFEVMTLIKTQQIQSIPIILVGIPFWQPLLTYIDKTLIETYKTVKTKNVYIHLIDHPEQIGTIIDTI